MLDVRLVELDPRIEAARQLDHARGEIDPDRPRAASQRRGGDRARTAGDVQQPHARASPTASSSGSDASKVIGVKKS